MTQDTLKEDAVLLDLACRQLGNELAQGGLNACLTVHQRLTLVVRKLAALQQTEDALKRAATAKPAEVLNGKAAPTPSALPA